MTENEIQELFVKNSFGTAKQILIRNIEQMGINLTGNEHVFELKALALNGRSITEKNVTSEKVYVKSENQDPTQTNRIKNAEQNGENIGQNRGVGELFEMICPEQQGVTENGVDPGISSESELESKEKSKTPEENNTPKEETNSETEQNGNEQSEQNVEQNQEQNQEQPEQLKPIKTKRGRSAKKKEVPPEEQIKQKENEAKEKEEQANRLLEEVMRNREEIERIKREQENRKKKMSGDHFQTNEVVRRLKCLGKAFLVGPAGTGKSTIAMQACAKIFGMNSIQDVLSSDKFAQISFSPDTVSADMIGFTDVNGVFHETDIIRVFRDGGLILFDEMDDADASLLVKLNTMLANGVIPTPNGVVIQNPETYIVGTANTFGKGGNSMYVGRSRLDAATLDRWKLSTIQIEYDFSMETGMVENSGLDESISKQIINATATIRKLICDNNWKQICSTRFVCDAIKMGLHGYNINTILNTFLADWDDNSRRIVLKEIRSCAKEEEK